jgi:hypothetical protein
VNNGVTWQVFHIFRDGIMNISAMAKLSLLACMVSILTGCMNVSPHPFTVTRGGYLEDKDYVALQKLADKSPPTVMPTEWPNPSPGWSYYTEPNVDFSHFTRISLPEPVAWNTAAWNDKPDIWTNRVANAIAKALVKKKVFQEVDRGNAGEPLALVGAVTFFHNGAVFSSLGPKNQSFLQAEFKVMVNGKQRGVIQALGLIGKNMIAATAMPSVEDQVANGVAEAMKRMKANIPGEASVDGHMALWFMK